MDSGTFFTLPEKLGALKSSIEPSHLALCSAPEARKLLPYEQALKLLALPLAYAERDGANVLLTAVSSDPDYEKLTALRFVAGAKVEFIKVSKELLEEAIEIAYRKSDEELEESINANEAGELPIHDLLEEILDYSYSRGATDLHVSPTEKGTLFQIRVDGELLSAMKPVGEIKTHEEFIRRLKILAQLDISKHALAQEGRLTTSHNGKRIVSRLSIIPTVRGERAVVRYLSRNKLRNLGDLGIDQDSLRNLKKALNEKQGLILVSGTTGSGKTTTLYAAIRHIINSGRHVCTVEDPIEEIIDGASQLELDEIKGMSFEEGLRALLRQDPDCVMIGEIRDPRAAKSAIQAAFSGHLIIASLHAGSIEEQFLRFEHFGVEPKNLDSCLRFAIHQELLPKLCDSCKVATSQIKCGSTLFENGKGCRACSMSGHQGRLLVGESLYISQFLKEKALKDGSTPLSIAKEEADECYVPKSRALELFLSSAMIHSKYSYQT